MTNGRDAEPAYNRGEYQDPHEGRGIPVEPSPQFLGKSKLEVVLTTSHA
jgi:DNA gyrase/topoisomerase IV subunit B